MSYWLIFQCLNLEYNYSLGFSMIYLFVKGDHFSLYKSITPLWYIIKRAKTIFSSKYINQYTSNGKTINYYS